MQDVVNQSPAEYNKVIGNIAQNLSRSPEDYQARQQWVTQLGQMDRTLISEPQQEVMGPLLRSTGSTCSVICAA